MPNRKSAGGVVSNYDPAIKQDGKITERRIYRHAKRRATN
jgi:hypothetical protein